MKHLICLHHNEIYTIPSTLEELKNDEYDYGLIQVASHIIKHIDEGCVFTTSNFQKASNYTVDENDLKKEYDDEVREF